MHWQAFSLIFFNSAISRSTVQIFYRFRSNRKKRTEIKVQAKCSPIQFMCILRALYINFRVGKLKCEIHSRKFSNKYRFRENACEIYLQAEPPFACVCVRRATLNFCQWQRGESAESDPTS